MPRLTLFVTLVALTLPPGLRAQEPVYPDVIARIREEGMQRSQVMSLAWYLTGVIGSRLTFPRSGTSGSRGARTQDIPGAASVGRT